MPRANRAARRRMQRAVVVRSGDSMGAIDNIGPLPGLPGGPVYISERELERYAETVFEAVAVMHPGMEQRKITAGRLGLEVTAPRADVESELLEIHARFDPEKGLTYGSA